MTHRRSKSMFEDPSEPLSMVKDISLPDLPSIMKSNGRESSRSRSSSPTRVRYSLPADHKVFQKYNLSNHDSLYNLSSSSTPNLYKSPQAAFSSYSIQSNMSSLSSQQLHHLSSSPISNKLHIRPNPKMNNYVIPVPLTLKFPPKLSAINKQGLNSSSTSPRHSPQHSMNKPLPPISKDTLIYTGNGYEHTASLLNYPVTNVGIKSLETKLLSNDELSVIEEVTNSEVGSSRASSYRSNNQGIQANMEQANRALGRVGSDSSVSSVSLAESQNIGFTPFPRGMSLNEKLAQQDLPIALHKEKNHQFDGFPSEPTRISSYGSQFSTDSWNSLQRSVELDLHADSVNASRSVSPSDDWEETSDENTSDGYDTASITSPASKMLPGVPMEAVSSEKSEDYEGVGRTFSFPNNSTNITNEMFLNREATTKSRMSFMNSRTGMIEIPNMDEMDQLSRIKSKRVSSFDEEFYKDGDEDDDNESEEQERNNDGDGDSDETADGDENDITLIQPGQDIESQELEPLQFPSRAARDVIKQQYKSMNFDDELSDSEDDAPKMLAGSQSTPNISSMNPARTTSIKRNVRHARHKSMFNIDFNEDIDETTGPLRLNHSKSKSMDIRPAITSDVSMLKDAIDNELFQSGNLLRGLEDIPIQEPPKPITYEVDFKEKNTVEDLEEFPMRRSRTASQSSETKSLLGTNTLSSSSKHQSTKHGRKLSDISKSSYQSSNSHHKSETTSVSDNSSVIIDLTKENYDVTLIKRNDSILSYKSVVEKDSHGKRIEVVLVEDDDENRDELESLYSKYNDKWSERTESPNPAFGAARRVSYLKRSLIHGSGIERSTTVLKNQKAVEKLPKDIADKVIDSHIDDLIRQLSFKPSHRSSKSRNYNSNRIQLPTRTSSNESQASSNLSEGASQAAAPYYDYLNSTTYDFNSFMSSRTGTVTVPKI